jgi:exonuclease III
MRVEHLTHVGKKKYELDTKFPGSLTAADVWVNDEYFACVVGMYLPYRKNANKDFIGHPTSDLAELKDDFKNLLDHCDGRLIVAGDLNDIHYRQIPKPLNKLGLVDPFKNYDHVTFRQDWDQEGIFLMDYIYVASELADRITAFSGGIDDFPDSMNVSDHAPLLLELK